MRILHNLFLLIFIAGLSLSGCFNDSTPKSQNFNLKYPKKYSENKLLGLKRDYPIPHFNKDEIVAAPKVKKVPLSVLSHLPHGEASNVTAITVVFNQPVKSLGIINDKNTLNKYLKISPYVPGRLRWVSSDTLKYTFLKTLQNAHEYKVTLKKDFRSLTGMFLKKEISWKFQTSRPYVSSIEAVSQSKVIYDRISPDSKFKLILSQIIDPEEVNKYVKISVGNKNIKFYTKIIKDKNHEIMLIPFKKFKLNQVVKIDVEKMLKSREGDLPMNKSRMKKFKVYGISGIKVLCDSMKPSLFNVCKPYDGTVSFTFQEPVSKKELLQKLTIFPKIGDLKNKLKPDEEYCFFKNNDSSNSCSRKWFISGDIQPDTKYSMKISASLKDVNSNIVKGKLNYNFRTGDFPPGIFPSKVQGGIIESWKKYSVKHVNISSIDIGIRNFKGKELVKLIHCLRNDYDSDNIDKCFVNKDPGYKTVNVSNTLNKILTTDLNIPFGVNYVTLSSPQITTYDNKQVKFENFVIKSSIGIHARLSSFGLTVWTTDLKSGNSLKNADVIVLSPDGALVSKCKTDINGICNIARNGVKNKVWKNGLFIQAEKGDDFNFVTPGVEHSEYFVDSGSCCHYHDSSISDENIKLPFPELSVGSEIGPVKPEIVGYVTTERGIYRPGEPVHISGAIRKYFGWKPHLYNNGKFQITMKNPKNEIVWKKKFYTNKMGIFNLVKNLKDDSDTGSYSVSISHKGSKISTEGFKVGSYRAPLFSVSSSIKSSIIGKIPGKLTIKAMYLSGGMMSGAHFSVNSNIFSVQVRFHGKLQGFVAGAYGHDTVSDFHIKGKLGKGGVIDLSLPLKKSVPYPLMYNLRTAVRSASYNSVYGSTGFLRHPGSLYPAVKILKPKNMKNHIEIKLLPPTPLEKTVKGKNGKVTLSVHPAKWNKKTYRYEPIKSIVFENKRYSISPNGRKISINWPKNYKKSYLIVRLETKDHLGRVSITEQRISKPEKIIVSPSELLENHRNKELKIIFDREKIYKIGDVVNIKIKKSKNVKNAILVVEREKTFLTIPLKFKSNRASVKLKIKREYGDRVSIRVIGIRSGKDLRGKKGPLLSVSDRLDIDNSTYKLKIDVHTDKKQYHPGEKVFVKVDVKKSNGKGIKTGVVLMAVDESVLRLTSFTLDNPFSYLLFTPEENIVSEDTRKYIRSLLISVIHKDHHSNYIEGCGCGGGGSYGYSSKRGVGTYGHSGIFHHGGLRKEPKVRKSFITTPFHHILTTDNNGHGEISFKLPDNVTSFRLMAFAVGKEKYAGKGNAFFKVSLPMMAFPALPRFLRIKDKTDAGIVVYNQSKKIISGKVNLKITGDAVRIIGAFSKPFTVSPMSEKAVRFKLLGHKKGTASLLFKLKSDKVQDALLLPLKVQRPVVTESVSVSGSTKNAVLQKIEKLSGVNADIGGLTIKLASTVLSGIESGMNQLIKYPYGCIEQQSSRVLPLLALINLGDRFNLKWKLDPVKRAQKGLSTILKMQRPDGGFSYWPGGVYSWDYATAYALIVLKRLTDTKKLATEERYLTRITNAVAYLSRTIKSNYKLSIPYRFSINAMILYALSVHGVNIKKEIEQLYSYRARKPIFSRALLLASMQSVIMDKSIKEKAKILIKEISNTLKIDASGAYVSQNLSEQYQYLMDSDIRSTAMVLLAFLHTDPTNVLIPGLAKYLVSGRRSSEFRNTQEAAWALMAFMDYARIIEKKKPNFIAGAWLGKKLILSKRFNGFSSKKAIFNLSMKYLLNIAGSNKNNFIIAKKGEGRLYYTARLKYARVNLPKLSKSRGFEIKRKIDLLDSSGHIITNHGSLFPRYRTGDTLFITIKVKNSEKRRFVAISDPIPAGMELLDTSLSTNKNASLPSKIISSQYDFMQLRDDRVLIFVDRMAPGTHTYYYFAKVSSPGNFVFPPLKVEEMYNPEIFGYTKTTKMRFVLP